MRLYAGRSARRPGRGEALNGTGGGRGAVEPVVGAHDVEVAGAVRRPVVDPGRGRRHARTGWTRRGTTRRHSDAGDEARDVIGDRRGAVRATVSPGHLDLAVRSTGRAHPPRGPARWPHRRHRTGLASAPGTLAHDLRLVAGKHRDLIQRVRHQLTGCGGVRQRGHQSESHGPVHAASDDPHGVAGHRRPQDRVRGGPGNADRPAGRGAVGRHDRGDGRCRRKDIRPDCGNQARRFRVPNCVLCDDGDAQPPLGAIARGLDVASAGHRAGGRPENLAGVRPGRRHLVAGDRRVVESTGAPRNSQLSVREAGDLNPGDRIRHVLNLKCGRTPDGAVCVARGIHDLVLQIHVDGRRILADRDRKLAVVGIRNYRDARRQRADAADRNDLQRLARERVGRLIIGEHINDSRLPARDDSSVGSRLRQWPARGNDIELDAAGLPIGQSIVYADHDRRDRVLRHVGVRLQAELLTGEGVAETNRQLPENRVREFDQVVRIRIRRQLEQVEVLLLPRLEVDHAAVEGRRLVLPRRHFNRQHECCRAPGRIGPRRSIRHLERNGGRPEILVRRPEPERLVVPDQTVTVSVSRLNRRGVGETHPLATDRNHIIIEIDC